MKNAMSELSFSVITVIAISILSVIVISFIVLNKNYIFMQFDKLMNNDEQASLKVKELNDMSDVNYSDYSNLFDADIMNDSKKDIQNYLKSDVDLDESFNISQKTILKLNDLTAKQLSKMDDNDLSCSDDCSINDKNLQYNYYKISNGYIVDVVDNKSLEYIFNYMERKTLFGNDKYIYAGVTKSDLSNEIDASDSLSKNEKSDNFVVLNDYNEDYVSKAVVNKSSFTSDEVVKNIYNNNIDSIVILNTYNNDVIMDSATGFFLSQGLIATSWSYIDNALKKGNSISAVTNSGKNYDILGVVTIDIDSDFALLKLSDDVGTNVILGNINKGDEVALLGTFSGFGLSGRIGVNLNNSQLQVNSLYISDSNIGSPLFNADGEVVGMVISKSIGNNLSNSISSDLLKKYMDIYRNVSFDKINVNTLQELSKRFYLYNLEEEIIANSMLDSFWNKIKNVGDIENAIPLDLIKCENRDNFISLRYLNDTNIDNNVVISNFLSNLEKENFKEELNSSKKIKYSNSKYNVTIYFEFNYIIVILEDINEEKK